MRGVSMNSEPSGSIVYDTGPLVEIISGSDLGAYAKKLLQSNAVRAYVNELNLGELKYLVCRKLGEEKSKEAVENLVESGFLTVSTVGDFISEAVVMKCNRSLAFADCFSLSMGESMAIPVLFATRETELVKEIKRKAFATKILFLDDLAATTHGRGRASERESEI